MRENHISDVISARIRQLWLEKGYSQEYMAEQLKMDQSGYSRAENNAGEMSINKLEKIAELLEVRLVDLVNSRGINNYFQHNTLDNNSSGGNIIINQYPDERLQKLEKMMEQLVKKNNIE